MATALCLVLVITGMDCPEPEVQVLASTFQEGAPASEEA